jgi:predicted lipoprotein with Yx(FWY)xxD motif
VRRVLRVLPLALLAAVGAGVAVAATATHVGTVDTGATKVGTVLVSANGRTLYRFTVEKRGKIACTGACAKAWPPLTIKKGTKPTAGAGIKQSKLTTIKRPDGTLQVAYYGFALYRYGDDKKRGDVEGQGEDHDWFTIKSNGTLVKTAASEPASTTTSTSSEPGTTTTTSTPGTTTTHGYGY